jgi:hypothetical protein
MEFQMILFAYLVFNTLHIDFASSTSNNMEGEATKVAKAIEHATKEHLVLDKQLKDLKK